MAEVSAGVGGLALGGAGVLALGGAGVWVPLGVVADVVALTGPGGERAELNDPRLGVLAGEAGIGRLRGLGWPARARVCFAGLLGRGVRVAAGFVPPAGVLPGVLRDALAGALAVPGAAGSSEVDPGELVAAAAGLSERVAGLLAIVGPGAAAADPGLVLRLADQAAGLPVLSAGQRGLLARVQGGAGGGRAGHAGRAVAGTAGVSRRGSLAQLLPAELALPDDVLMARLAEGQLLFRRHDSRLPPAPEPVTVVLDTTPPAFGVAEGLLRLAAHLMTLALWEHGLFPVLVTLTAPGVATPVTSRAQLARVWTTRTLRGAEQVLDAALVTAGRTGRPVVVLAHHHVPGRRRLPGPGQRLLTTHHPAEPAPPPPGRPGHFHLPPDPGQAQLTRTIHALLTPASTT